jgi:hypothetical protein
MPNFISDFSDELARIGDQAFSMRYPHPVLVVTGIAGSLGEQRDLHTTVVSAPSDVSLAALAGLLGRVFPLVKNKMSPPGPIIVGRTSDNDVVIPESSISKRHCFLRLVGTELVLTDAGSTNGTSINNVKLEPKKSQVVNPGDAVTLGRFIVTLHTPRTFVQHLRSRANQP